MNFDLQSLFAGFVFGVIGYWLFQEGKKREDAKKKIVGIAMMVYPYFVEGAWANWAIGIGLCAYVYYDW